MNSKKQWISTIKTLPRQNTYFSTIISVVAVVFAQLNPSVATAASFSQNLSFSGRVPNVIMGAFTSDGSYIWVDNYSYGSGDGWSKYGLRKMDSSGTQSVLGTGTLFFSKNGQYAGLTVEDMVVGKNDSIYLTGTAWNGNFKNLTIAQSAGLYIAKFDSSGSFLWVKPTGLPESVTDMVSTTDGGVSLLTFNQKASIHKYSDSGLLLWESDVSDLNPENYSGIGKPGALASDSKGDLVVAGRSNVSGAPAISIKTFDAEGKLVAGNSLAVDGMPFRFFSQKNYSSAKGTFAVQISSSETWSSYEGGYVHFMVNADGTVGNVYRDKDSTFRITSISSSSDGSSFVGGVDSGSNLEQIKCLSGGDLKWDAHYNAYWSDSDYDLSNVFNVQGSLLDGITFTSSNSRNDAWFRSTYAYPSKPNISDPEVTVTENNVTARSQFESGNLYTHVRLEVSESPSFVSFTTHNVVEKVNVDGRIEFIIPSLARGKHYYLRLRAENSLGQTLTTTSSFTVPTVPDPPVISGSLLGKYASIVISRPQDNGSEILNYIVEKQVNNETWTPIGYPDPSPSLIYVDSNSPQLAGKLVKYRVKATNIIGDSFGSNELNLQLPEVPNPPQAVTATYSDSKILISWMSPVNSASAGEVGYLFQVTADGLNWTEFDPILSDAGNSVFFDAGMPGASYKFRISALNAFGASGWSGASNVVKVETPKPTPATSQAKALVKPSISGKAVSTLKGLNYLTARTGTWTGVPTPKIAYQWFSCSTKIKAPTTQKPASCKKILGATGAKLQVKSKYKGIFLTVAITGTSTGTSSVTWFATSSIKVS